MAVRQIPEIEALRPYDLMVGSNDPLRLFLPTSLVTGTSRVDHVFTKSCAYRRLHFCEDF